MHTAQQRSFAYTVSTQMINLCKSLADSTTPVKPPQVLQVPSEADGRGLEDRLVSVRPKDAMIGLHTCRLLRTMPAYQKPSHGIIRPKDDWQIIQTPTTCLAKMFILPLLGLRLISPSSKPLRVGNSCF